MADAMREKVARTLCLLNDEKWDLIHETSDSSFGWSEERYRQIATAALEACHFEELVTALERIKGFPKAAEQTGHGGDYQAGLELAASYAVVALAKVKDEGHG